VTPVRSYLHPEAWAVRRVAELEEEVAYLKSELGLSIEATRIDAVKRAIGVPPRCAKLLLALHDAHGRVLRVHQLEAAIGGEDDRIAGSKIVNVLVWRLRRAGDLVRNTWGLGYAITPLGAERVRQALGE
jgi:DNA-binding response OmpR family regulator